jgi:hypothetical protein
VRSLSFRTFRSRGLGFDRASRAAICDEDRG